MKQSSGYLVEFLAVLLALASAAPAQQNPPQQLSKFDRDRATAMLQMIGADVRKHYYDPKFHGLDWDARVAEAKQKIETSPSMNSALSHIAGALDSLNDSHTFFLPPPRPYKHDYGFQMQMFGDHCFVTRVRPKSDAESKGLKAGDELLAVNGFHPTRDDFWRMEYVFNALRPQTSLHLDVRSPSGGQRQVEVVAKMKQLPPVANLTEANGIFDMIREFENQEHLMRTRWEDVGDDLEILKMPEFGFTETEAEDMVNRARKHKALIVDLRSNPGGAVTSLKALLGRMFENDIKIGDRVQRDKKESMEAKSHHNPFTGKLLVLVDSRSASASELFARVVQIEKRGVVMGDHSSGSVMESRRYGYQTGMDIVAFFGASITDADLIMTDGKSLEHTGVTPDEIMIPTAADLASGRDPVLAHAAETLGYKITPEEAGKFFSYEWSKE
ncbi:MAG: PDZ domain-containing protein [Acidobacteriia bacterium]|nr:PDZ domain-containing protein [Terriglobia bacterium]